MSPRRKLWIVVDMRSYEFYRCALCREEVDSRAKAVWHSKRHARRGEARIIEHMAEAPIEERYEIFSSVPSPESTPTVGAALDDDQGETTK